MSTAKALDDRALDHHDADQYALDRYDLGQYAPTSGLFVVASAPAGWYDLGDGTRRWFDGKGWTEHYAAVLELVPAADPARVRFRTEHGFHLIMVVMTLGVWAPVWAFVAACNRVRSTAPRTALLRRDQMEQPESVS